MCPLYQDLHFCIPVLSILHPVAFVGAQFSTAWLEHPHLRDGVLSFLSESVGNLPAGYRARETYRITGPNSFVDRFEIAEPGKDFEPYTETSFRRK